MTAKPTFRDGPHASSEGALIEPFRLDAGSVDKLSKVLGRGLCPSEIQRIGGFVETMRGLRLSFAPASSQEVKSTLQAMEKAAGTVAVEAFADCDQDSRCCIDRALYHMGVRDFNRIHPKMIRTAAARALQTLQPAESGRRSIWYRQRFAAAVPDLWKELTGAAGSAWSRGEFSSPLVEFSVCLLELIDPGWKAEGRDRSGLSKQIRKVIACDRKS
ncbi:MAG: hypothetical protein JNL37_13780 [Thauera sp.]|nr:hypothetical protein [Thauera sp.]